MVPILIIAAIIYLYYQTIILLIVKEYSIELIIVVVLSGFILSPLGMYILALLIPSRVEENEN